LKLHLSQERDKWFHTTGQPINKNNFLQILSEAYVFALTPENVKTVFRKTGIVPFNPSVITADMLATSKETSTEAHLPVTKKTASEPIQIIADMLRSLQLNIGDDRDVSSSPYHLEAAEILVPEPVVPASGPRPTRVMRSSNRSTTPSVPTASTCPTPSTTTLPPTRTTIQILEDAVASLKRTNLQFLATPAPTTSADPPPRTTSHTVRNMTGTTNTRTTALSIQPTTENELLLLSALRESEAQVQRIEVHAFELQASNILNEAYADRLSLRCYISISYSGNCPIK